MPHLVSLEINLPRPTGFESYKGFVMMPNFTELESTKMESAKWTIGGFIRSEGGSSSVEEPFHYRGHFAASHEEAIERGMIYSQSLIDARESK